LIIDFFGSNEIGLYCFSSDKICILGKDFEVKKQLIEKELKVEVFTTKLYNTNFIGLFSKFNSNGIVLSKLCSKEEIQEIKKLGLNIYVSKSKYTAIGNLILVNDKGAIVSNKISKKEVKEIENVFGVETVQSTIAKSDLVGSSAIATNKGCLVHRDCLEEEAEIIKEVLKVNVNVGTVNSGSPYVGFGIVANSNGFLVSQKTTPIEINRILEILFYEGQDSL